MTKLITAIRAFVEDDLGATMVEYALMVAMIAIVCAAAVATLGTTVKTNIAGASAVL